MSSIINTNLGSINAQRSLSKSQNGLAIALQRLSSGLRINSAKDDAAGIAIGDRMTSQIRGQYQALRNTNDGISLLNVAEGNLSSITDNTQRIRELAVQSSNGTYSPSDRQAMQAEVDQLIDASFSAADQATFNTIPLLDGTFSGDFQVGANRGDSINVALPKVMLRPMVTPGPTTTVTTVTTVPWNNVNVSASGANVTAALATGDLIINGVPIPTSVAGAGIGQTSSSAWAISNAIMAAGVQNMSVQAETVFWASPLVSVIAGVDAVSTESIAAGSILVNGIPLPAISAAAGVPANTVKGLLDSATSAVSSIGYTPVYGGNATVLGVLITDSSGEDITIQETVPGSLAKLGWYETVAHGFVKLTTDTLRDPGITIDVSGNHPEYAGLTPGSIGTANITPGGVDVITTNVTIPGEPLITGGDPNSDVLTQENAQKMIVWADQKLQSVNGTRGYIGAMQNRFESVVSHLANITENLGASRSRIMDADFAAETAELTRNQILQQAGTAMLAQANSVSDQALSLLKDL